jgi:hypothetical protein
MTALIESRPPMQGQQHSYSISPPRGVGCQIRWLINNRAVALGDKVGGLEVKGFGASGSMTVEVIGPVSWTEVEAQIDCPEMPTAHAGPMLVGTGMRDRCDEEPCKSDRQAYIRDALAALDAARNLSVACFGYKLLLAAVLIVLILWVIVLAAALVCHAALLFPTLCFVLDAFLAALSAGLAFASVKLARASKELLATQRQCAFAKAWMKAGYVRMQSDCPRECWLPEVKVDDCGC